MYRRYDAWGHLAYLLLGAGSLLLAWEMRLGWAVYVSGDLIWAYIGWRMGMSSIYLWSVAFASIRVYGLVAWSS